MAFLLELRRPIPTSEPARFRPLARRTGMLRVVLALALVGTLVAAVLVARSVDPRHAPLVPSGTTELPVDPWKDFRAGTRISQGLRVAQETLRREGTSNGSIVLVSDLEILPDEVVRLSEVAAELRQDGVRLRIVALFPTPEKYARIRQIVGDSSFLRESAAASPVAAPEGRTLRHALPWAFVLVAALLVGLLALNEGLLSRLEVRR